MKDPRYPEVRVAVRSSNSLALVSAVRFGLRRAGVDPQEIASFSQKALSSRNSQEMRRLCAQWATLEGRLQA